MLRFLPHYQEMLRQSIDLALLLHIRQAQPRKYVERNADIKPDSI